MTLLLCFPVCAPKVQELNGNVIVRSFDEAKLTEEVHTHRAEPLRLLVTRTLMVLSNSCAPDRS
jgi:hypothetical protein